MEGRKREGRAGAALPRGQRAPRTSHSASADAAAYAELARRFERQPGVALPAPRRGKFGENALKVDGKIFAMLVKGALAVKLPPVEVQAATEAGRGEPLAMGKGRAMKEWLVVHEPPSRWYALAERARAYVAGERSDGVSTRRQ